MQEPRRHDRLRHVGVGRLQIDGEQGIRRPGTCAATFATIQGPFTPRPPARARRHPAGVNANPFIALVVFRELAIRSQIHVESLNHGSAMGAESVRGASVCVGGGGGGIRETGAR